MDQIQNNPAISIILPTYNRLDMVMDTINSVINQDYQNWKMIIIDDHSDSNLKEYIEANDSKDCRISIFRNDSRMGLPGSRNIGLSLSHDNLILFIEDDMVIKKDALKLLVESYLELSKNCHKIGGIAPSIPRVEEKEIHPNQVFGIRRQNAKLNVPCKKGKITKITYFNFSPRFKNLQEVPDVHSCSLYSRIAIDEAGRYDDKRIKGNYLFEETDLNTRIVKLGYSFFFNPKAIFYHLIGQKGGCRVDKFRYGYFFLTNYLIYAIKNYGIRSSIMIPAFICQILLSLFREYNLYDI